MLHRTLFLDLIKIKFLRIFKGSFWWCAYQIHKWHNRESAVDFKKWTQLSCFLFLSRPFVKWLLKLLSSRYGACFSSLWRFLALELFWATEYRENDGVPVLSRGLMGPLLVSLAFLGPLFWYVDKSRLACWRNHEKPCRKRLTISAEVLLDSPAPSWPSSWSQMHE